VYLKVRRFILKSFGEQVVTIKNENDSGVFFIHFEIYSSNAYARTAPARKSKFYKQTAWIPP